MLGGAFACVSLARNGSRLSWRSHTVGVVLGVVSALVYFVEDNAQQFGLRRFKVLKGAFD